MGSKREASGNPTWLCFDKNAPRLRLIVLRGDNGQRSSEMTRAVARSGHSPSLTQPDEPLGHVEAYCISVPAVMHVCVFLSWKECFPRISQPGPQKNNTYYFKMDYMTVYYGKLSLTLGSYSLSYLYVWLQKHFTVSALYKTSWGYITDKVSPRGSGAPISFLRLDRARLTVAPFFQSCCLLALAS